MINYTIQDPTTEITFNLGSISYEHRRLVAPSTVYTLGEWVGLGTNNTAVKWTSTNHVLPRMVWTPTGRHDVVESEGITVAVGYFHISTMSYKVGESFAIGDELVVLSVSSAGVLGSLPSAGGTYFIVGAVRKAPAIDGTDRLFAEIFPAPQTIVVP